MDLSCIDAGMKGFSVLSQMDYQKERIIGSKVELSDSLVVQWLRICVPIWGIWVQTLVWKDPTYHELTKPMHHNY